jgi:transcriptional regulator with XRE-family HTH domain
VYDLRLARGLSQEKLAERADLSTRHLQAIEHGKSNVTLATELALARALKVPLSELFSGV